MSDSDSDSEPADELYNALRDGKNTRVDKIIEEHDGFTKVFDGFGNTAIHIAARQEDVKVLTKIWRLRPQPPIGQKTNSGQTALHDAAYFGRLKATQWLVGHGIDPQAVDKYNDTAKDVAKRGSKTEVVNFLEKMESMPPENSPVKQPSPLNYFAINNDVKALEDYFSRESQTDNDGTDDADSEVITYVSFIL
jgi:ankyrin repeat protein